MLNIRFWSDRLLQKAFLAVDYTYPLDAEAKRTVSLVFIYKLSNLRKKLFFPDTVSRVEVLEGVDEFFDVLIF